MEKPNNDDNSKTSLFSFPFSRESAQVRSTNSNSVKHRFSLSEEDHATVKDFLAYEGKYEEEDMIKFLNSLAEKNKILIVLNHVVKHEIEQNELGLMREETLGATLLKNYWFHFESSNYLKHVVKPAVKEVIVETKAKSLEIDPTKVSSEEATKNRKKLFSITQKFLDNFYHSSQYFPGNFEIIMKNVYKMLSESEGSSKSHLGLGFCESAIQKFGGFLLLRFICPAIVSPTKYGLAKAYSKDAQRTFILISKIIQSIANQVEFEDGEKSAYMAVTNEFVQANVPSMMAFLTRLVSEERVITPVAVKPIQIKDKKE